MRRILLAVVVLFSAVEASALPAGPTTLTPSDRKWEPYGLADRIAVRGDLADAVPRELVAGTVFVIPEGRGEAMSTVAETIVQREFPGLGPGICKWREPRP